MITRTISGVLVSALAAGAVMFASVAPASASEKHVVMHADVDAWQVALLDGRESSDKDQSGSISVTAVVDEGLANDAFILSSPSASLSSPSPQYRSERLFGAVEYRIVSVGEPRAFWIKANLHYSGGYGARCDVYLGAPSAGGKLADPSPFTCRTKKTAETSTEFRYTFSVGLNRDAEASGAISPTGAVSLENGTYKTYDVPYAKHGHESVPSGGTTTFDTVLREGDTTPFQNQARNEFAYRIYDNGEPTKYWVAGLSTNYRGAVFKGDGRCAIYPSNPLAGERQLDQSVPLRGTGYTCSADGSYKTGAHEEGRVHYFTHFTVSATK